MGHPRRCLLYFYLSRNLFFVCCREYGVVSPAADRRRLHRVSDIAIGVYDSGRFSGRRDVIPPLISVNWRRDWGIFAERTGLYMGGLK